MVFVACEDDKGNVIIKTTSSIGKMDEGIIILKQVQYSVFQESVEEIANLLCMPSESLDDFAKSMESLGVEIQKNNNALMEMYTPGRKNKARTKIQTRQQVKSTLKYKRYELRIYVK